MEDVRLIDFQVEGRPDEGFISIAHALREIPFEVKRIFITTDTPPSVNRGRHAHFRTEMILIAASGTVKVKTENSNGAQQDFVLDSPFQGLYLPAMCWHEMSYSPGAVQVVIASTDYDQSDYIRDYAHFRKLIS